MLIAINRADGGVSLMTLAPGSDAEVEVAKWKETSPIEYVGHAAIDPQQVPTDSSFRAAWRLNGEAVEIDMGRARDIQRNRLRTLRAPMLAALDIEYQRADEVGDDALKQQVAQRKQVLRDVTDDPRIDAATTPEELMAVVPEALA